MTIRHALTLPDLGLGDRLVTASVWLVAPGDQVSAGDRVLEVLCGSVTVDLQAPATGVLAEVFVEEEEPLTVGQTLALIEGGG
jgi:pyruvate/2-oxoglutarate dehydrogenase complex dihydrolipoamide acyltransferase (E2) component